MEISSTSGAYHLMHAMMNEKNIYRYDIGYNGLLTVVRYDVTEYEIGARKNKSPLVRITEGISTKIAMGNDLRGLMATPLMKTWSNHKFHVNIPMLFLWFLHRLLFCVGFYMIDVITPHQGINVNGGNGSIVDIDELQCVNLFKREGIIWTIVLVVPAASIIIFDICEIIYGVVTLCKSRLEFTLFWQHPGNFTIFRCSQSLLAICVMVKFFRGNKFEDDYIESMIVVLGTCMNVWVLLFFGQLIPIIGAFAAVIQDMVKVCLI